MVTGNTNDKCNGGHIHILDLFSGIGGFALAAEIANAMADADKSRRQAIGTCSERDWQCNETVFRSPRFSPLAHAEVEPFACAVYHRHFPDSVCFGGVENVSRDALLERCGVLPDVVCGGFPCQPHSCAGKRLASEDERDLWGECRRILGDVRPRFALFENVSGLLTSERGLFFNRILSDLAALRYACQWQVVPASAVGAPHRRDRVWLLCWEELADSAQGGRGELRESSRSRGQSDGGGEVLADGERTGLQGREVSRSTRGEWAESSDRQSERLCGTGLLWPAVAGHWPSRPGEQQHAWEPPRVVGHSDQRQRQQHGRSKQDVRELQGLNRGCGETDRKRQVEPALGASHDGLPAAMGGTWPEVHNRVAQLKAAGNAIVPEVAAIFLYAIRRAF